MQALSATTCTYGNEIATLRSQSLSDASTFGNNLHYGNEIATLRSQ